MPNEEHKSLKGHLLLAGSRLLDPNFAETVVLMVQHDDNGALGLILNRPLETSVKEVCSQVLELPCAVEGMLHQGGPCEGPLMVVHTHALGGQLEVVDGVYFTTEREQIESLLVNAADGEVRTRFFVGYAGWTPGQLEAEMQTGSWLTAPADIEQIFSEDIDAQWKKLMQRLTVGRYIDPDQMPRDPNMN